jgi:3-deoxy-D-manno-octulosonic-acid transferase
MVTFLYHILWTIVFLLFAPFALLLKNKRLLDRLALDLPPISLGKDNLWVHALSVGEVISAVPLVSSLSRRYPDRGIVFSVTTVKGIAIARKELEGVVKSVIPMPVDSLFCVRRICRHINPSIFILVETDIWPALVGYLKRMGIKTILVNGRISPRTFKSYRRFSFLVRKMFKPLELCLMQSDLDRNRLVLSGIKSPSKVVTIGNIKFDREWETMDDEKRHMLLSSLGFDSEDIIWVAGSTHPGEDEILLNVHKKLRSVFPSLRLILAPRKIEQSDEILWKARNMGLETVMKSEIPKAEGRHSVLILNTMGELGRIYGLSQVSFVGGSLVPFGGHNLLEPASFGCAVVFGKHTHNFVLMSESMVNSGGGRRVHDGDELYEVISELLASPDKRLTMGKKAKEFVEKNAGALDRAIAYIGENMTGTGGQH